MDKNNRPALCVFWAIGISSFLLFMSIILSNYSQANWFNLVARLKLLDIKPVRISYQWVRDFFTHDLKMFFLKDYKVGSESRKISLIVLFLCNEFLAYKSDKINLQIRTMYKPLKEHPSHTKHISNNCLYYSIFLITFSSVIIFTVSWFIDDVPPMICSFAACAFNYAFGQYFRDKASKW